MTTFLTNKIITLRALEPTDLEILFKWENDTSLWAVGSTIAPYSHHQLWEYLKTYDGDIYTSHQLRFMITLTESGEPIGTMDFYDFDPFNNRAAIGLLISSDYQHKGYGEITIELIEQYASQYLGLKQIHALIPAGNAHSISLFRKLKYHQAATLKSWLKMGATYTDAFIFQRVFGD